MTGSKTQTYDVRGAEVIVTANVYPWKIDVCITVDLSSLDAEEPDHSPHQLINYLSLPGYDKGRSYWWCKTSRSVTVRTGSQARRVIKHALAKIDDAVAQAIIDRTARKSHIRDIFV